MPAVRRRTAASHLLIAVAALAANNQPAATTELAEQAGLTGLLDTLGSRPCTFRNISAAGPADMGGLLLAPSFAASGGAMWSAARRNRC